MPQGPRLLSADQFLLTELVAKLAVMAVTATMVARYRRFRHILIFERRAWPDRLVFSGAIGIPLAVGVLARLLLGYQAADLSLEGAFLAGLIAGPYAGALVGLLVSVPAMAIGGEFIALPVVVGSGFAGGGLRLVCPKEAIWLFTPFVFVDLRRHVWHSVRRLEANWQLVLMLSLVALELLRQGLGIRFGIDRIFYLQTGTWWMTGLVILSTVLAVATPIRIWNSARVEHRLQEQEKLLLTARVEALKSQINPHFLFNTLTSVSSLIRTNPDTARTVITKLSGLLRRLIRQHEHFVPLREELDAVDEYLDIEVVRFGPKLTVKKEIAPDTLDIIVPSMLLQPIVENAIKHGLSRKIGPGCLTLRSRRENGRAIIEVEDDGMGMLMERLNEPMSSGIGLANVRERLRVVYGSAYQLTMTSEPGKGTCARIEVPELTDAKALSA